MSTGMNTSEEMDVAVIGAGPSGLAAAARLAESGLKMSVLDEQPRPGGQILRRPPAGFSVNGWLGGSLYRRPKSVLAEAESRGEIDWHSNCTAYGLEPPNPLAGEPAFRIWAGDGESQFLLRARAVIVATGAYELPVPFPGWTLPGVMGAGGLQTFLKSQQVLPGRRFVLAGSHPLQLVVADQILEAGGEIALIAFSQTRRRLIRDFTAGIGLMPSNLAKFAALARILARLTAKRVPLRFNTLVGEASGTASLERVRLGPLDAGKSSHSDSADWIDCDSLGVCYGFVAANELARQAGAAWDWDPARGGWLICEDGSMRTKVPGMYVAGETTGVDGADAAIAKGHLAASAVLEDQERLSAGQYSATFRARRALKRELRFARFLQHLAAPPWAALDNLATPQTIICRCECVPRQAIDAAAGALDLCQDPNAIKLATRAGMGLCQGRLCAPTIARLTQDRQDATAPQSPAPFTPRMPAKPVPIGTVASLRTPGSGNGEYPPNVSPASPPKRRA